ncbi:MAG: hypothetical protein Q9181_006115 [Wetmoreana brouardii]
MVAVADVVDLEVTAPVGGMLDAQSMEETSGGEGCERDRLEQESFEAQTSFLRNHVAVRNYFVARYGVATNEDRNDVGNRLLKRGRAQQEDLDRAFFTGMAQGATAYLWERRSLWRTRKSREDHEKFCISSYVADYNWNSSDDEDIGMEPLSNQRYRSNDDESEASEAGDYFPDYQREQLEKMRVRWAMDREVNDDYDSLFGSGSELSGSDDQSSTRPHHIQPTSEARVETPVGFVRLRIHFLRRSNSREPSQEQDEADDESGGQAHGSVIESTDLSHATADSASAERNQERGIQVSVTELPKTSDGMGEDTPTASTPAEGSRESPTGEVVNSPLVRLVALERRTVLEEPVSVDEILRDGIRGAARRYPWRLGARRDR